MIRDDLSQKKILAFWTPLAATWLMMALEGPFLAALIARLAEPKFNLAAYGVAFSIGVFIEAPIIMIMSASTALVKDRASFLRLRNFTYALSLGLTLAMLIVLIPPVFDFVARGLIGLPEEVARLTHRAALFLAPWPGAIGYRRFYQGILIRSNLTRRVAYGTLIRLLTMGTTGLIGFLVSPLTGAAVGTLALSVGVTAEAAASRLMVHRTLKELNSHPLPENDQGALSYRAIARFYYPLALTSILGLGIVPLVTFFMGQSRMAIDSLAVFPVINALIFIFRSLGLSYQEVGIALLGDRNENLAAIRRFALFLGGAVGLVLALVAFTPLAGVWFRDVSGLSAELTRFSVGPTRFLVLMPSMMVLLSFQRSFLVNNGRTRPITVATAIEVSTIIVLMNVFVRGLDMVGVTAAAAALIAGRVLAVTYLFFPFRRLRREVSVRAGEPSLPEAGAARTEQGRRG